jgi:hypothetical protein
MLYVSPFRFHSQNVAAELIVMPRFCSSRSKSMTAVPSWTSPILWIAAGVVQDALGRRRLAGVDVGGDADVANLGQVA